MFCLELNELGPIGSGIDECDMSYGNLTNAQGEALKPFVKDREVYDFGAGDFFLSQKLLKLGAKHVVAIDKEFPRSPPKTKKITAKECYFHEVEPPVDVLFLSWPVNWFLSDLVVHVHRAKTLIYLGSNTDYSACGSIDLFEMMIRRELLAYVPHKHNSLIVTGNLLPQKREPTGEERAALTMGSRIWRYEEIGDLT
jgi:hypothetical protein